MSTFDDDDDVRRDETDELHGIDREWFPVGTYGVHDDRVPTSSRAMARVWPDSYRYVAGVSL